MCHQEDSQIPLESSRPFSHLCDSFRKCYNTEIHFKPPLLKNAFPQMLTGILFKRLSTLIERTFLRHQGILSVAFLQRVLHKI